MRVFLLASMAESCLSVTRLPMTSLKISQLPVYGTSSTRLFSTFPSRPTTVRPSVGTAGWEAADRGTRLIGTSILACKVRKDEKNSRITASAGGNWMMSPSDAVKGGKHREFQRHKRGFFAGENNEGHGLRPSGTEPSISAPLPPSLLSHERQMSTGPLGKQQQRHSKDPNLPARVRAQSPSNASLLPPFSMSPAALAEAAKVRAETKAGINQPSVALQHLLRVRNDNRNHNALLTPIVFHILALIVEPSYSEV